MQIIQSLECIELTISAADKTAYFPKEMLFNKNITALYLLSSDQDRIFFSPYNDDQLLQIDEFELGLYLNLFDTDGNPFVKKLSQKLITKGAFKSNQTIQFSIDRLVNWEKSNFEYKGTLNFDTKLLIYVLYNETEIDDFSDEINGSLRVELPFSYQPNNVDYQLSKVFPAELSMHKIKKIIPAYGLVGYFDLLTNKGQVKNIATPFLEIANRKEFFFDNLTIDLEKSYFRNRGNSYTNYVTFIW